MKSQALPLLQALGILWCHSHTLLAQMTHSPDQTLHDIAHMAFCALVALHKAIQDDRVSSPMAEHLFIVRWLATAQKQKRFPKTVAFDIQLLQDKAPKQGMGAKLKSHLWYAWRSCSGDLRQQSDLFRLTHIIESLKALGWRNELLNADEWNGAGTGKAPALFVVKALLVAAFNTEGRLMATLDFKIAGDPQRFVDALTISCLPARCTSNVVTLIPH